MAVLPRILVIVGPTASGKTSLAIECAKKYNGEVISADSRQVYRGLDIGTEKVTLREMRGVPHHCLDIASPKRACSVQRWRSCAERAVRDILRRNKVPIVAGGSWFYVDALVYGTEYPNVPPNASLRRQLARKTHTELCTLLDELDPVRGASIERRNPRRLIRAIEIATALGTVPPKPRRSPRYDVEWVLLDPPDEVLRKRIEIRLARALKRGLIREVEHLRSDGISWKRLHELGLEYRAVSAHLQGTTTHQEMREEMLRDLLRYAKKQSREFKLLVQNSG